LSIPPDELERIAELRHDNGGLSLKVSEKGALSLYGMRRFATFSAAHHLLRV